MKWLLKMLIAVLLKILGKPNMVIGENYLERWYLIPRNRIMNVYLHKFTGSDDDRALHDHPWHSVSLLLKGRYHELVDRVYTKQGYYGAHRYTTTNHPKRFVPFYRRATHMHRTVLDEGPVWTLVFTGPVVREWGFLCPKGWVHWKDFTDTTGTKVGAGCGD